MILRVTGSVAAIPDRSNDNSNVKKVLIKEWRFFLIIKPINEEIPIIKITVNGSIPLGRNLTSFAIIRAVIIIEQPRDKNNILVAYFNFLIWSLEFFSLFIFNPGINYSV